MIYKGIFDTTNPFWTFRSVGIWVNGLPLVTYNDAVVASCRFPGQAPIYTSRCKILDDAYVYPGILRAHLDIQPYVYILDSHPPEYHTPNRGCALSVPIFEKLILSKIWKHLRTFNVDDRISSTCRQLEIMFRKIQTVDIRPYLSIPDE